MSETTRPDSVDEQTAAVAPRPGAGPPGRPSLGWTELAVAAVAYLALSVLAYLLLVSVLGPAPDTVALIAITGLATVAAAAVALAVRVRSPAALGLRSTSLRWLLVGLGAGVLACLVNRGVVFAYIAITGDTSNPQQSLADTAAGPGPGLIGLLLTGALLVPFAEELLFRGIGYGALRRYGVLAATVASSVLFGLAHGVNVVLPAAIVLGVVTALLYERSRSIWPAVVAHATNNAILFGLAAILL